MDLLGVLCFGLSTAWVNLMKKNKAAPLKSEIDLKIASLERKIDQMAQYKKILEADGLSPDQQDKEKESRLILELRKLVKMQSGQWKSDKDYRPGKSSQPRRQRKFR